LCQKYGIIPGGMGVYVTWLIEVIGLGRARLINIRGEEIFLLCLKRSKTNSDISSNFPRYQWLSKYL
jgi:hypothetical protein